MTHRRQFKSLLAVVTLATASPAVAGPHHDHSRDPQRVAAPPAPTAPTMPMPSAQPRGPATPTFLHRVVSTYAVIARAAARPRELPCGAPACGNVTSRAASRPREPQPIQVATPSGQGSK